MQQQHEEDLWYPGAWCFPGGWTQPNELPNEAIVRVIREDLDLRISYSQCLALIEYQHDDTKADRVYAVALAPSQHPTLREGWGYTWKTWEEITQLELGFEQEKILPRLEGYFA